MPEKYHYLDSEQQPAPTKEIENVNDLPLVHEGLPGERLPNIFDQECFLPLWRSLEQRSTELRRQGVVFDFNTDIDVPEEIDLEIRAVRIRHYVSCLFFSEMLLGNLMRYGIPEKVTSTEELEEAFLRQSNLAAQFESGLSLSHEDLSPYHLSKWLARQAKRLPSTDYQLRTSSIPRNREIRLNFLRLQIRMIPDIIAEPDLIFLPEYYQENYKYYALRYPIYPRYTEAVVPTYRTYCVNKMNWLHSTASEEVKRSASYMPFMMILLNKKIHGAKKRILIRKYIGE